jgi:hypothetical protein
VGDSWAKRPDETLVTRKSVTLLMSQLTVAADAMPYIIMPSFMTARSFTHPLPVPSFFPTFLSGNNGGSCLPTVASKHR